MPDATPDPAAGMRALVGEADWSWPEGPWLRANMVSSLDGAATGADGLSGSINNAADRDVFHQLREGADAIIVGAGTARAEGYRPADKPLIVIGTELPGTLRDAATAASRDSARPNPGFGVREGGTRLRGGGIRLEAGGDATALRDLVDRLHAEGLTRLLCEGGPTLLGDLLRAGLVDELCLTFTPKIVAGDGRRIVGGELTDVRLELSALVDAGSTLISRWLVSGRD